MALILQATLNPTKLELLTAWLPGRSWFTSPDGAVQWVSAFRFDDPAGAVGVETILVRAGDGTVYQVPLTYRDAPLAGGDAWMVGTTEHSVLGRRWVYDATGDPVYAAALAGAILGNTGQAEQFTQVEGRLERREPSMGIAGSAAGATMVPVVGAIQRVADGDPTVIVTDTVELAVLRRLGIGPTGTGVTGAALTGIWPGQETAARLASAIVRQ